ncbi:MAG: hypothetical protein LBL80_00690 [Ruminococcus sp.]|jgi:hypothetical protein|nr:hypothetical protein [Ruminococcus sp.]
MLKFSTSVDENSFFRTKFESALKDPTVRNYLDGIFNMIRNIVGHGSALHDYLISEINKDEPDREMIAKILREGDTRLMNYLGSITDAHHLLSIAGSCADISTINISETLADIAQKFSVIFGGFISLTCTVTKNIYARMDRVSLEIAVTDFIEHIIVVAHPAAIDIIIEMIDPSRARLTINSKPGGTYPLPEKTESEAAVHASDFAGIFVEQFVHSVEGTILINNKTPPDYSICFEFAAEASEKIRLASKEAVFEFDNTRFSPAAAKLSKYFKEITFR